MALWGVIVSTVYHKRTVEEIIQACVQMGIRDQDIYLMKNNTIVRGEPVEESIIVPYKECVQIFDVNIHIVDHCNMNCELCCHFSQLVQGEVFVDFHSFCRDLDRLHELVPDIVQISLLGGEPLLHPDLIKFVDYTRKLYPYAKIMLVTNGLLLRQSSKEVLDCIKKNQILVSISLYPPMHHQLDTLLEYINDKGLDASISRVDRFFKKFSGTPRFDPKEMSAICGGYCMGLSNGKISRCVNALYMHYFNAKYGKTFPETCGYDIYDESRTALELIHLLEQPMDLCRYCVSKYTLIDTYEWKQITKKTKKEDILYQWECG